MDEVLLYSADLMKSVVLYNLDNLEENAPSQRYGHTSVIVGKYLEEMKWVKKLEAVEGIDGRHFHTCEPTSNDPKDSKLIFFGGKSNGYKNDVFEFDIATEKWRIFEYTFKNTKNLKSCMNKGLHPPTPRYGHSSCYYNERVFIFGGYDKNAFSKNDLYCFNFRTNMWKRFIIAKIPRRYHHSGVLIGSNYFILGGINSRLQSLSDIYRLDLSQLAEQKEEDEDEDDHGVEAFELSVVNPIASYGHKCLVINEKIYLYGGRDPSINKKKKINLLRLDHGSGNLRWREVEDAETPLSSDTSKLSISYGSLNLYKEKLLFFGGQAKKIVQEKEEEEDEGEEEEMYKSDELPYDTIFLIFEFLELEDLRRICMVSKDWTISIAGRSDRIWSHRYFERKQKCFSILTNYQLKEVKRRKTSYEKFKMLMYQEKQARIRIEEERKRKLEEARKKHIKTVLVGDGAVGKTCLLIVYASEDRRFPTEYVPTVFDNHVEYFDINGVDYSLGLWDTAGEEDYDELRPLSYTGAKAFLVCASSVNPVSFSNVKSKWIPEIKKHRSEAKIILCMTKTDLRTDEGILEELRDSNQEPITFQQAKRLGKEIGASAVVECSSYTGDGVREVFDNIINSVLFPTEKGEKCGVM